MDFGWNFLLGDADDPKRDLGFDGPDDFSKQVEYFKFAQVGFDDKAWRAVDLPHDWAEELKPVNDDRLKGIGYKPLDREYPRTTIGWYRKVFTLPGDARGQRVMLELDGMSRDARVWVNGFYLGRVESGYTPAAFDVTEFVEAGKENCVAVRCDLTHGDGWFYSGAGLYRHVWLRVTSPLHLEPWETVVRSEMAGADAAVSFLSRVKNRYLLGVVSKTVKVRWEVSDGRAVVASAESAEAAVGVDAAVELTGKAILRGAKWWSPETPHVYTVVAKLVVDGKVVDEERTMLGVRTVEFTADRGMLLNGKSVKLKGVCLHHDHACVGAALPDALHDFRLRRIAWMGSNAMRTSHNCPTPELMDACDRMGVMVMCETRNFSTAEGPRSELETMVKRYRNHPSVVIWSLGNEEMSVQGEPSGARIVEANQQLVRELDPTRQCTLAMNGGWGKGASPVLEVMGFNYKVEDIPGYHKAHPGQPLVGTETASMLSTRGIYVSDKSKNWVDSYDEDKKLRSWPSSAETWWKMYGGNEWLSGGFAWTGLDYRGEPTPYGWPSTSSQFGILDLCGFAKDEAWYYKAWWGSEPVVHLMPHWNLAEQGFKPGDPVRVVAYTNYEAVELVVNGKSFGVKPVERFGHAEWKDVPYAPGWAEARAMRGGKVVATHRVETVGAPATLRVTVDRAEIAADGEDAAVAMVEVLDAMGRVCPMANVKLRARAEGPGRLLGMGNGDPNSLEFDAQRPDGSVGAGAMELVHSSFNGLAQVVVQSRFEAGQVRLVVESDGLTAGSAVVTVKSAPRRIWL